MDNKKIFLPIYYRVFMILWGLFSFYGLTYFVLIKREDINVVLFVFGIMFMIFIPLTILMFVNYKFSKDEILELSTTGINIIINKKKQIHFHIDYLELIKDGNKETYFYKELKAKHLLNNVIVLKTENDERIGINIWKCRGRFGLFEHLINYGWYKKGKSAKL